jgi:hypothetical protein
LYIAVRLGLFEGARDFEDSVTTAATAVACDLIVTPDLKGFRASPVPVLTPEAAIPVMRPPDVVI